MEDKLSRGQEGTRRDGGSPGKKKKRCQNQFFSQKRGELRGKKKGLLLSVSLLLKPAQT